MTHLQFAEREKEDSGSEINDAQSIQSSEVRSLTASSIESDRHIQEGIDRLFDPEYNAAHWLPPKPSPVLGELMESRYMLPLVLPSEPQLLRAVPLDHQELLERNQEPNTPTPLMTLPYRFLTYNERAVELRVIDLIDGEKKGHTTTLVSIGNSLLTNEGDEPDFTAKIQVETSGDETNGQSTSPRFTALHPQPSLSRKARVSATE